KINAYGVTLAVADLYPLVERVLPRRFGGRVGDYQLIESQDQSGISHLTLRVDPSVGELDETAARETLLHEISATRSQYRFMADIIRAADAMTVERKPAERTAAGKILPVLPASSGAPAR